MAAPQFKGWDWTELLEHWNLPIADSDYSFADDRANVETLRAFLEESNGEISPDPEKVAVLKEFLKALIKEENGYGIPVWEGLLKIEDDLTFEQFFLSLVRHMWT